MDNPTEVKIKFSEEGITQSTFVKHLRDNLYQIEDISASVWDIVQYRDVIEAELQSNETLMFKRVVQASDWQNNNFLLSKEMYDKEELGKVLREVEAMGGKWERVLGGVLTICLPPECQFDIKSVIDGLMP